MIITWISKEGGRAINEDEVGKSKKKGIVCVVVADGLGGHGGGEIASELAVNTILSEFEKDPGFSKEHILKYIESAKEKIVYRAMNDPELLYMSSTVAVLLIKGRRAIWANVGDSRVYKFCDGLITDVSEDHSLAFIDFVNGEIEYDQIRTSPNQNKLTSAIGVAMDGVNVSEVSHINSHTSFLLCTDGWWEHIPDSDMEASLSKAKNAQMWLMEMLKIREENAPSDSDNFTAAAIMV